MNVLLYTLALFCVTANQIETSQTADTFLYIRTVPSGAQILLDGKPLGNSDGLFPVNPGTYKIVVDLEGHESHQQEITIVDGRIKRIELVLNQSAVSNLPKPDTNQTETDRPTVTVMLPDVDQEERSILDLASGKLVENIARNEDASGYVKLGKGDLWQDSGYFGTVRNATAMLWDGAKFAPFQTVRSLGGTMGYGKLTLPCRLLITTTEKVPYDVSILWMDEQGSARIDYRLADSSLVPDTSDSAYRQTSAIMGTVYAIETALSTYYIDKGQYPTTAQGLEALIRRPISFEAPGDWWRGPYIKADSIPLDPWGTPYQYKYTETNRKPRVWSKGQDQISGTSDDIPVHEVMDNRIKSATNLSGIGKALLIHANDHDDMFPPDLQSLMISADLHPKEFVSPSKPEGFAGPSYVYVDGQRATMNPNNVVAYENPAYCQDGINVLYLDGHVAWEDREVFLRELEATYNRLERPMPDIKFKNSAGNESTGSDNTIFEMILNDLDDGQGHEAIDLDTKKQYDLPEQNDSMNLLQWTRENGIDLFADYASNRWALMTSNLTLKKYMPIEIWDRLGPAEVQELGILPQGANQDIEILDRSGFRFYILDRLVKTPQTFAFKTHEGAFGMMQITEFLDKPRGIKIRYRLVKRSVD